MLVIHYLEPKVQKEKTDGVSMGHPDNTRAQVHLIQLEKAQNLLAKFSILSLAYAGLTLF
ncbi:hypothetical protein DRW42_06990 [Pedobacter miscanthi]|uniref:Uncharacterized protein n=1 Tax=Pedobacter miscanthi TaxID=2259170 RepID=A0A366L634_9SPHI|nr:hypothetical protein DRW42_06990 [Pedobacter miscanthi]